MLLERETELALTTTALHRAASGHGSMVAVRGGLGVGKSALLEAICDLGHAHDALILRAQGAATERGFSFGVVRQLIEPALDAAPGAESARWLRGTAGLIRAALSYDDRAVHESPLPTTKLEPTLTGLNALIGNMARDRTVLLVVDDLHWADPESLRMLWRLASARRHRRILLVCSLMAGDIRVKRTSVQKLLELNDRTVEPANLSAASTRALVEEYFGVTADEEFVRACHHRSGGNPLFLQSVLADAQFHGLSPRAHCAEAAAALRPILLRQRLLVFLQSMPDPVRRAAFAMTVLGGNTDPQLLRDLAELDDAHCTESLRVLQEAGLGLVDDRASRTSARTVLWDVLEESMPLEERAAMRGVAAELLHRSCHSAEQAAEQLMAVVTLDGRDAIRILRTAAASALHRGSPRDAARYLRRAIQDSAPAAPQHAQLLIDLATAERSFATAASLRHVVEALPLLETTRERAAAIVQLGPVMMDPVAFHIDDTMRRVATDLSGSASTDFVDRELALRLEARGHFLSARNPAGIQIAQRRLSDLGPQPPLRTVGERELLTSLIHVAMVANTVPAAELAGLSTRLLEHEPPSPGHVHTTLPLALNVLAAAEHTKGAAHWLRESYRLAESRGGDVEQVVIRAEQALVAFADGNLADARTKVHQADALVDPELSGLPTNCAAILALVALNTGDAQLAEQILSRHRLIEENQHLAALRNVAKGSIAARAGDTRAALEHFRIAGLRMDHMGWRNPVALPWPSCAALMHHRLGQLEQAAQLALREVEEAHKWGAPTGLGRAMVVLGRVTPGPEGVKILEEAVDALEKGTNSYELCRALYALGNRNDCDPGQKTIALTRALALAAECNAPWVTQKIRWLQSEKLAKPSATRASLTRSERRVALLATSGLSNHEISAKLSTSSRMVEKHLTNSYRKLGIDGRPGLAAALAELDAELGS